ncbi:MAG: transporter substrate-binding domain-containing protein [Oscillospiraceae bacterium]
MKMKRMFAFALSCVLLLALGACGGNATESATPSDGAGADRRVLRVGMECAYAPYNWAQSGDSNGAVPITDSQDYAYGYDVMMAKLICEKLDWDLEIYKLDWDSLPLAVQSGKIDCAIAGQSITSERLETVDFTEPYYYASIVTLVKKDSAYANAKGVADLQGAKATSQVNTVWYDVCLPQIKDAKIQPAMESAPSMLVALDSGKVDLVVTDMPTAMAACVAYPNMMMLDFTDQADNFEVSAEEINIGISTKKGNAELTEKLNSVLSQMTEEDFTAMMDQAIAVQPLAQ